MKKTFTYVLFAVWIAIGAPVAWGDDRIQLENEIVSCTDRPGQFPECHAYAWQFDAQPDITAYELMKSLLLIFDKGNDITEQDLKRIGNAARHFRKIPVE